MSFILPFGNVRCYLRFLTLLLFVTVQHHNLKCFKGYLRTSMTTERLSDLALINIHHNKPVDYDAVVQRFAEQFSRRILLVDPVFYETYVCKASACIQLPRHEKIRLYKLKSSSTTVDLFLSNFLRFDTKVRLNFSNENPLVCSPECWKTHFRGLKFQYFPETPAPDSLRYSPPPPFINPRSAPEDILQTPECNLIKLYER